MNDLTPASIPTTSAQQNSRPTKLDFSKLSSLVIIFFAAIVIGFGISFVIRKYIFQKSSYSSFESPNASYVIQDYLENPMFTNWTMRIKGKVIEKKQYEFSLQPSNEEYTNTGQLLWKEIANSQPLKVVYFPLKTYFKELSPRAKFPIATESAVSLLDIREVEYQALEVGDFVKGTAEAVKYKDKWYINGLELSIQPKE